MRIRTLTDTVGAEIEGVRLDRLDDASFDGIRAALDRHGGVLFRDQSLEPADLVAFSRRFGELDHAPVMENGRTAVEGLPEIYIVSNVLDAQGRPIGSLGAGEAVWHTDMSYLENPPDFSMLYALEVPASGGDTWLSSMAAAHDDLPGELREQIADLSIKHDGTFNSGGYLRQGVREDTNPATSVGQPHPVICAHPRTGRPVLYLGRRRNAYVMGLELEASETLLDRLWEHATRPELAYAHRWRPGDLLLWDNRATMHRRDPFDPAARRVMRRTQIRGHGAPRPVVET
ncbi:MAG: TauD/TfdA family dioxygenase [Alphaproteobacteria bacterium]|nr:TauD/TfdA family dioxygenase [Alphaproteobacteria bacterium]